MRRKHELDKQRLGGGIMRPESKAWRRRLWPPSCGMPTLQPWPFQQRLQLPARAEVKLALVDPQVVRLSRAPASPDSPRPSRSAAGSASSQRDIDRAIAAPPSCTSEIHAPRRAERAVAHPRAAGSGTRGLCPRASREAPTLVRPLEASVSRLGSYERCSHACPATPAPWRLLNPSSLGVVCVPTGRDSGRDSLSWWWCRSSWWSRP